MIRPQGNVDHKAAGRTAVRERTRRFVMRIALVLPLVPPPLAAATLDLGTATIGLNVDGKAVGLAFAGDAPLEGQAPFEIETEDGRLSARSVRLDGRQLRVEFEGGAVAEFAITPARGFALFQLTRLDSDRPVKRFRLFSLPVPADAADVPMLGAAQAKDRFIGLLPASINVHPVHQQNDNRRADRAGCTHTFVRDPADPRQGGFAARFTAISDEKPGGWSYRGRGLPRPLDLTGCRTIRAWVHGDGKGQSLKIQLADDQGGYRDDYLTIDFTGWRQVTLDRPDLNTLRYDRVTSVAFYYNGLPAGQTVSCGIDQVEALVAGDGGAERPILLEDFESPVSPLFDGLSRQLQVQTLESHGIKPAAFGLIACAPDEAMDTIRRFEQAANLPSPHLGGQWNKTSDAINRSYLFLTRFSESQFDEALAIARRGGFSAVLLGQESWCRSTGHYEINRDHFPDGIAGLKRTVDRFHAEGFRVGLHFLAPSIDSNDPYLTPKPDPRLVKGPSAPLRAAIDAKDNFIPAATADFPREDGGYNGDGTVLQIGDELIHYTSISADPPGFSGCARGHLGTTPASHPAGATVSHLSRSYGYHMFDMDTSLLDEVTTRFARVVNACGIDMVYFDGSERLQGDHWYYNAKLHKAFHDKFDNKNVLLQASSVSPYSWHLMARVASADGHGDLKGYLDQRSPWFDNPARGGMPLDIGWYYGYDATATPDMYEYILGTTIGYGSSFSFQVSVDAARAHPFAGQILDLIARYEKLRLSGRVDDAMRERLRVMPANRGKLTPEQTTPRREYRLVGPAGQEAFQRVAYGDWHPVDVTDPAHHAWRTKIPAGGKLGVQLHAPGGAWLSPGPSYSSPASVPLDNFDDLAPYTHKPDDRNITVLPNGQSGATLQGVTQHVELTDQGAPGLPGAAALYTAKSTLNGNDGWSVIRRTFDPPLNLSNHRGIGFWLRGDGQGGSFKLQLMDASRATDYYVKNDYNGWRYHQLARPETDAIDYTNVRSLLLYYNGLPGQRTITCGIDGIRALPAIDKRELTDPWVEVQGRRFAWQGTLGEGQYLEFWPGEATRRHAPGMAEPKVGQEVPVSTIEPGDHGVKVGATGGIALPLRVRVTVQPPERHDVK
jgi:hypothetical protein